MGEGKNKAQIRLLTNAISSMQKQHIQTIEAFQKAFGAFQEKINDIFKALAILGHKNPEILELLQIQPEEGSNEDSSGDGKPRILSMPGLRDGTRTEGKTKSSEDKASN